MSPSNNTDNNKSEFTSYKDYTDDTLKIGDMQRIVDGLRATLSSQSHGVSELESIIHAEQRRQREEEVQREWLHEIQKQEEVEESDDDDDEAQVGPSARKKRKIQEMEVQMPRTKQFTLPCSRCMAAKVTCYGLVGIHGCRRCYKHEVECNLVDKKRRQQRGKGKVKGKADGAEPQQDRMMEMMERLTEAVEGIGYTMDMWMRRQMDKEQKGEREEGKGKRKEGVQKETEE